MLSTGRLARHVTLKDSLLPESTCVGHRQCSRLVSWRGVVSTTLPRLWPAAPLTIPVKLKSALQAPVQLAGLHNTYTIKLAIHEEQEEEREANRAATLPSQSSRPPKEIRGAWDVQSGYVHVHLELPYTLPKNAHAADAGDDCSGYREEVHRGNATLVRQRRGGQNCVQSEKTPTKHHRAA